MCVKWKLADKHAARDHLIRHQRRCQQPQDEVRPYMDVYLVREGERCVMAWWGVLESGR